MAVLSAAVVEFAYNENVVFSLAQNQQERVQAYFLAVSAINFTKLILKADKEVKGFAKSANKQYGTNVKVPPLYELVPLNTFLLRQAASMGVGETITTLPPEGTATPSASGNPLGDVQKGVNLFDPKVTEQFLAFEGDFSAVVTEEEAKINLNAFYQLNPKQKEYLRLRRILFFLLASEEFKDFFSNRLKDAEDLAGNIADFIDRDDLNNGLQGEELGPERSKYQDPNRRPKNGKLISLEELLLVEGMNDDLFEKLKNHVTIYGKDDKILACRANDSIMKAMILAYVEGDPRVQGISMDNKELLDKAVTAAQTACPDVMAMTTNVDTALGIVSTTTTPTSPKPPPATGTTTPTTGSATFGSMIKTESFVYTVIGTGAVGEDLDRQTKVNIRVVLDTTEKIPAHWKLLYWRVE